jgi:hypothetical protein
LEESTLLSRIFFPRGGDAIVKMFSLPQAEEVDQCPIYIESTVTFFAFTVNSPLLRCCFIDFRITILIHYDWWGPNRNYVLGNMSRSD